MTDSAEFTPPPGWVMQRFISSFSEAGGPYYFREDGAPGVAFYAETRHANLNNIVHGGALMTLADMALFNICKDALAGSPGVTVSMNAEFLNPGPIGAFIEARGEQTKAGRSLLIARGEIVADDAVLMTFSGVLKRLSSRSQRGSPARRRN